VIRRDFLSAGVAAAASRTADARRQYDDYSPHRNADQN